MVAILIVRGVMEQVRAVRLVMVLVSIVLSVVEAANAPTTVLVANARIVWDRENKIVRNAMVTVHALFVGETTNCFQIVVGVMVQTSANIVEAQEKRNV